MSTTAPPYNTNRAWEHYGDKQVEGLNRLARAMLGRHLYVSIDAPGLDVERTQRADTNRSEHTRVVAAVGAGASAAVLHRGLGLVKELQRLPSFDPQRHEGRIDELTFGLRTARPPKKDFEAQLSAMTLARDEENIVRRAIHREYSISHPTILAYELLAHFVKHRFIDGVINFNWDEMLDRSLADELGREELRRVVSERDCSDGEFDPNNPSYRPTLLKPHGTASDPDTLRFTLNHYFWVPERIRDCQSAILGTQRCVVIALGYGMRDEDFLRALLGPRHLEIYNLSASQLEPGTIELLRDRRHERQRHTLDFDLVPKARAEQPADEGANKEPAREPKAACDVAMTLLAEEVAWASGRWSWHASGREPSGYERPQVHIRSVHRHELISLLFGRGQVPRQREYLDYLRDRAFVELLLAAVRGRGLVSIASLANERAGIYYKEYARQAERIGQRPTAWPTLCSAAGLREKGNETYVAEEPWADTQGTQPRPSLDLVYDEHLRQHRPEQTADLLWKLLTPQTRTHVVAVSEKDRDHVLQESTRQARSARTVPDLPDSPLEEDLQMPELAAKLIRKTVASLSRDTEVEIRSCDDSVCSLVFASPRKLVTHSALRNVTRAMLWRAAESDGLVRVAVVAETGGWLLSKEFKTPLERIRNLNLDLIVAFRKHAEALRSAFEHGSSSFRVSHIPWYRHNRHMTLVVPQAGPPEGIYFARRLRSALINPVYLRDQDAVSLMRSFIVYAVEAAIRDLGKGAEAAFLKRTPEQDRSYLQELPGSLHDLDAFRALVEKPGDRGMSR